MASPGHAAVVTHPAVLLLVVAAAGLAGVKVTVQTLTLTVHQELKGLQAADTVRVRQLALTAQQLLLRVLLLDLCLQISAGTTQSYYCYYCCCCYCYYYCYCYYCYYYCYYYYYCSTCPAGTLSPAAPALCPPSRALSSNLNL